MLPELAGLRFIRHRKDQLLEFPLQRWRGVSRLGPGRHRLKNAPIPLYLSFSRVDLAGHLTYRVLYINPCKPSITSFKMTTRKLILTRRAIFLCAYSAIIPY